jgi:hypothetical protein
MKHIKPQMGNLIGSVRLEPAQEPNKAKFTGDLKIRKEPIYKVHTSQNMETKR